MTTTMPDRTAELERKIDQLTEQVAFIAAEAEIMRERRESWDELRHDFMPLAGEALYNVNRELEEVQEFVRPDDLLRLLKRLVRNTRNVENALERFESAIEFLDDVSGLSDQAFIKLLRLLEEYEERGYFRFAKAGLGVVDRVVTNFTEEDVEALGDNVVLILETVKEMTQPEIMAVLYRMIEAVQRQQDAFEAEPEQAPSMWALARQLRDPEVRRGMARALNTLKAVSDVETGPPRKFVPTAAETTDTTEQTNAPEGGS
jgi:uncharacterized protein YjgD (DUF1641 family)